MILTKLGYVVTAFRFSNKKFIFNRLTSQRTAALVNRHKSYRFTSNHTDAEDEDENKPIKFLGSEAAKWDPVDSRTGGNHNTWPWYQPYVVMVSLGTFMIYFCVLREENDIDLMLMQDLADHFKGVQRENLIISQSLPQKILEEKKQ